MERVNEYRQQVQSFLRDFTADDPHTQVIFDTERDHYLVVHNAWHDDSRTYGCAMHLDIIDGKVWIQHNSTEIAIDQELRNRGIAKEDIVLGFRSPSVRSLLSQMNS
jgi:hypothetical protein